MKEKNRVGLGVFVCVFNKDLSKIMLIRRNTEKRKKWKADWGNVGGRIEFGETSVDACIREVREETGLKLKRSNLTLIHIKETPYLLPYLHAVHFVYVTSINENSKIVLNAESESYKWFKIGALPQKTLDKKKDIITWWKEAKQKI